MRGLSQRELARKAGLSPTAVSQIECGTIAEPSQPTLDALNKAMRSWIGLVPARRRAIDCALARYREQVAAKSTTPEEIEWLQEHLTQEVFLLLDPGNMHRAILSRRQRRA
jgi:transcriptional regulator with XRE-family HTH domain